MKIPAPYKCDLCGAAKGKTNHWWLQLPSISGIFLLARWDDDLADADGVKHICSESCASKALSKHMAGKVVVGMPEPRASVAIAASDPEPVCPSCGNTLAHFAGPGAGERGLVCQTPGCDLEEVSLQDDEPALAAAEAC